MFQELSRDNDSDRILKQTQIEALKSILQLLVREVSALDKFQATLTNEIKGGKSIRLNDEIQRFESDLIRCALIRTLGRQNEAAKLLGLKNSTLNEKIKRHKIKLSESAA